MRSRGRCPNTPVILESRGRTRGARERRGDEGGGDHGEDARSAGGRILRDAKGNPTGVFVDNAQSLFARSAPRLTQEQLGELLHAAAVESNKWGLTEVQDMGEERATIEALESLAKDGEAAAAHLRDGDRRLGGARRTTTRAVRRRRSTTGTCGCAGSSSTPTARSARAARRCSLPTAMTAGTRGCWCLRPSI